MSSTLRHLLQDQLARLKVILPAADANRDTKKVEWLEASKKADEIRQEISRIESMLKTLDDEDAKAARPTIMQAVMEVLRERPEGMTALEIMGEINRRHFGGSIVRTSLSPQLSRLKDRDHKINLLGNRWFLAGEEAPTLFTQKS